ncbi:hypothetical protein L7F22_023633 [Adiantum nelumboides]|nr:hypothetical protein [Adiantum nelumboides]
MLVQKKQIQPFKLRGVKIENIQQVEWEDLDELSRFLNGDIFEEVYVTQLRDFVKKGQKNNVCKCNTALYGLKQSPHAWYEKADTHLVKRGFCNSPTESTLYIKHEGDVLLIVVLYVDDLLITRPNERHIAEFKADLNATFKMKDLGLLHHYLGIQFNPCDGGIALCQKETLLCGDASCVGDDTEIIIDKFEPPQEDGDASVDAGGAAGADSAGGAVGASEDTKIIIGKSKPPQEDAREDSDAFVDASGDASYASGAGEDMEIIVEKFEPPQKIGDASVDAGGDANCTGGAKYVRHNDGIVSWPWEDGGGVVGYVRNNDGTVSHPWEDPRNILFESKPALILDINGGSSLLLELQGWAIGAASPDGNISFFLKRTLLERCKDTVLESARSEVILLLVVVQKEFKKGFVWQDLESNDDLIFPTHNGSDYVVKGCRIELSCTVEQIPPSPQINLVARDNYANPSRRGDANISFNLRAIKGLDHLLLAEASNPNYDDTESQASTSFNYRSHTNAREQHNKNIENQRPGKEPTNSELCLKGAIKEKETYDSAHLSIIKKVKTSSNATSPHIEADVTTQTREDYEI